MNFLSLILLSFIGFSCSKEKSDNVVQVPVVVPGIEIPTATNQVKGSILSADGKTDTYKLINKVFGGTGDVTETPDCAHAAAGPHITQVYDEFLKTHVFVFTIHVTPDNDRCLPTTDRQRNEIKTYNQSPDSTLASLNEKVKYTWKFKLDKDFKPSPNFTHIHQLKALDGDDDLPLITLTARFRTSGNRIEVIHTGGTGKNTSLNYLATANLSDFLDQWVEVTEVATYSFTGKYEISIKRLSDSKVLLSYSKDGIDMWRDGTTLSRPKWGIYRSLLSPTYLRDESIRFNDFSITEIK
ncbi:hypothetical protein [Pedobacter alpinus]|uniref:Polysaccharide lyase n=1 Tax=Pedobacter alpinus TaxID=1590643 RepID=A0ABW5TXZ7_9SPHI